MALGQSFYPGADPTQQRPAGTPPDAQGGPQSAIKVLNLRLPRVTGAGAPAPQALLSSPGSGGLPQMGANPILNAIIQAVMGHFSPQAPGGAMPDRGFGGSLSGMGGMGHGPMNSPMPSGPMPTPAVHYQPTPGGTAGPNPNGGPPDLGNHFQNRGRYQA